MSENTERVRDAELTALDRLAGTWKVTGGADATACAASAEKMLREKERHPVNAGLAMWALGLLDLAEGRFDKAADRLEEVCAGPGRQDFLIRAVPDQAEAAMRSGRKERVARHLPAIEHWAEHTGRPHATALAHRCRALQATDDAEERYTTALRLHRDAGRPYDHARTALLYGEWLRRRRRRTEAHTQLAEALKDFE